MEVQSSRRRQRDWLAFHLHLTVGVVYTHNILNVFNTARRARKGAHDPRLDTGSASPCLWYRAAVRVSRWYLRDLDPQFDHDSGRTRSGLR